MQAPYVCALDENCYSYVLANHLIVEKLPTRRKNARNVVNFDVPKDSGGGVFEKNVLIQELNLLDLLNPTTLLLIFKASLQFWAKSMFLDNEWIIY